jgi:hypothetical protein
MKSGWSLALFFFGGHGRPPNRPSRQDVSRARTIRRDGSSSKSREVQEAPALARLLAWGRERGPRSRAAGRVGRSIPAWKAGSEVENKSGIKSSALDKERAFGICYKWSPTKRLSKRGAFATGLKTRVRNRFEKAQSPPGSFIQAPADMDSIQNVFGGKYSRASGPRIMTMAWVR